MSISEQVKGLRYKADIYNTVGSVWELNRAEAKILQGLLRKAADTIEVLSANLADMERSAEDCGGGWITCKEMLPDNSGMYIVTAVENELYHTTFVKWQSRYKKWDLIGARAYWKIVAWKPLPKPYHEP